MNELLKLVVVGAVAGTLALSGCEKKESAPAAPPAGHDDHAGHDHGDGDDHDDHGHGEARELGTVEVGGTTLRVSVSGAVEAHAELHIDIERMGGAVPAAVRVWVGDESASGSVKSKADADGSGYHAHAEVPATVTGSTALWVEVESASGERAAKSLALR